LLKRTIKSCPDNTFHQFYAQKKKLFRCQLCHKHEATKQGIRDGRQKYFCPLCEKYFSRPVKRIKSVSRKRIISDHLAGLSYRQLEERTGIPKKRLCRLVNSQVNSLPDNLTITKSLIAKSGYSGNYVVDGKCIPVKEVVATSRSGRLPRSKKRRRITKGRVLIWGADYETHDLLHHGLAGGESYAAFSRHFQKLKEIGYPMKSLTLDDKREIAAAAKAQFPDCVIQLCVKHYLAKINRALRLSSVKVQINAREKRLEKCFLDETSEYIPTTRYYSMRQAVRLINEIFDLEDRHELLLDFQAIIASIVRAENYQIALNRIASLENYFWPERRKLNYPKEHIRAVRKLLFDFRDNQECLLNYLKYPHLNISSTTNLIEGYNSQLELRLASIRGFETEATAEKYLNAWILKRRLTKFTDCRKQFRKLNGKSPLECAGADISDVRKLIKAWWI